MVIKKEIQEKIIKPQTGNNNLQVTEEEFLNILKLIAHGTSLRTALDGILRGGKGGLIAIENEALLPLIEGGFRINTRFTPQRLIELSKMDGAIILSKDLKKINYANVLLTPNNNISSNETGTRHKAAERTAKQTGTIVVAISERRHEITLYCKKLRYPIAETDTLLRKTNEQIQILEKQKESFDNNLKKLDFMELRNLDSLNQAVQTIQKGMLIKKLSTDLQKNIIELGKEGMIIKTRLKEVIKGVERETDLIIKDYTLVDLKKSKFILDEMNFDDILSATNILKALGFDEETKAQVVCGWRILSKTILTEAEIATILKETGNLGKAIHSGINFYQSILGKDRAEVVKEEIRKLKLTFG